MPYKFDTLKKRVGKRYDRRRKLTDEQKEEIRRLYGTISQRKLAKMFGVSRRLITFIGCPEKYTANLKARLKRGGSKIYYDTDSHTESMRHHRHHKQRLNNDGLLKQGGFKVYKKKCRMCETYFECDNGNRVFCFDCSPSIKGEKNGI